jgi:hypothetical protein
MHKRTRAERRRRREEMEEDRTRRRRRELRFVLWILLGFIAFATLLTALGYGDTIVMIPF